MFFCGTITFWAILRDFLRGQKSQGPLKKSLEMAQKVIVPKKNYVPNFLKQWNIGNFMYFCNHFQMFKGAVSKDFLDFFISWIEATDEQAKMVLICEKDGFD